MARFWRSSWRPVKLFFLLAAALLFLFAFGPRTSGAVPGSRAHTIRVEASQYRFEPGVLEVSRGDEVTIELVAADVVHGLYLDGYGLEMTAEPGQTARLTFVADRPGAFRFRCSVACGAMHPFMIGKLRVGPNLPLWGGIAVVLLAAIAGLGLERKDA